MKKRLQDIFLRARLYIFVTLSFFLILPVVSVSAQTKLEIGKSLNSVASNVGLPGTGGAPGAKSMASVIGNALGLVLGLLGLMFFLLILYGGIQWLTAQGKEEQVDEAKRVIEQAVWGFLFVAAAYTITNFVVGRVEQALMP